MIINTWVSDGTDTWEDFLKRTFACYTDDDLYKLKRETLYDPTWQNRILCEVERRSKERGCAI